MQYVKKMCILRQIKQGFSGDGKTLSGLIKAEQYGKNLAVEVSIINFAPLVSGEYYCLLSDGKGKTEMLSLHGKSMFNILSDIDISGGFCGIICYVKNEVVPIAYGINGNGNYDWRSILNATLPPVFPKKEQVINDAVISLDEKDEIDEKNKFNATLPPTYDDERVAKENYYESDYERKRNTKIDENARDKSTAEKQAAEERTVPSEDDDAESLLHPFQKDPDGYYLSIKREIDELFSQYPKDDTLKGSFSCSEWVRIKGEKNDPKYLVGVVYEDGKAQYICYAVKAEGRDNPPKEFEGACVFVPCSVFDDERGFFVLFQSTATGECIQPKRA